MHATMRELSSTENALPQRRSGCSPTPQLNALIEEALEGVTMQRGELHARVVRWHSRLGDNQYVLTSRKPHRVQHRVAQSHLERHLLPDERRPVGAALEVDGDVGRIMLQRRALRRPQRRRRAGVSAIPSWRLPPQQSRR